MATRNLTKKFIDIRNANKANRGLGLQVIIITIMIPINIIITYIIIREEFLVLIKMIMVMVHRIVDY